MKRTVYYNDTMPGEDQLNFTESSKIAATLERSRAFSQFGVQSGFRVTVNGLDTTRIDIGVGEGYTGGYYATSNLKGSGSGERVATNEGGFSVTASSVALADYTNGTSNYVSLVFSESSSEPLAERSYPFASHDTKYEETFTVSVLNTTNWNALTTAQRQNRILVAIVVARGVGVALSSSDITQTAQPRTHPVSTQPSSITGVSVIGVSPDTPTGNAILYFTAVGSTLRYRAPSDAVGAAVTVGSSGEYTVYSNTTAYYIIVNVTYALLPVADQTDTLVVTSLYGRTIPLASASDVAHRDLVGDGLVTAKNCHGLSYDNIQGGSLSHADLFHRNGITYEADATQLSGTIVAATDTVEVINLGGTANTFLIDGTEYETIDGVAAGVVGQEIFTGEATNGDFLVYLDSNANLQRVLLADYAGGVDYVLWTANISLYDMFNTTAGTGTIRWNATTRTLDYQSPADNGGAGYGPAQYVNARWGSNVAGYYKLYSGGLIDWVIVYVADSLGGSNSSAFTVAKSETVAPDDSILKLCVVTWRADTGNLVAGSLRDIRKFLTADITPNVLLEHDDYGLHTKELQNQLRIGVANNGFQVIAETSSAAFIQARSGSVGLSVAAPTRALMASASKNTAGQMFGIVAQAYNHQNDANAVPIGVWGEATNTATAKGIGGYFSAGDLGVYGFGSNMGMWAYGGGYGIAASGATAAALVPIGAASVSLYGVSMGCADLGAVTKSRVVGIGMYNSFAAGASIKDFYGFINRQSCGTASDFMNFYAACSADTVSANCYGINHGYTVGVASLQAGIGQYVGNTVTASTVLGINMYISAKDVDVTAAGIQNYVLGDAAAGKIATANAQYNYVSARECDVARGWYGVVTAADVTNIIIGIENTAQYTDASRAQGGIIRVLGNSVNTASGLVVQNSVTASVATAHGISNSLSYGGAVAIPNVVYGIANNMDVSNGLDVCGNRNIQIASSASLQIGIANSMYAAKVQSQYGLWNVVGNTGGVACNNLYGQWNQVNYTTNVVAARGIEVTLAGSSAGTAAAFAGVNVITSSVNEGYGLIASAYYDGAVAVPSLVYGASVYAYGKLGTEVGGIHISAIGSSIGTGVGIANHVTVATANTVYGIWNSVKKDAGANYVYGHYTQVDGNNNAATVVGMDVSVYNGAGQLVGINTSVSGIGGAAGVGINVTGNNALYGIVCSAGYGYGAYFSGAYNGIRTGKPTWYDFIVTNHAIPVFGSYWLEATINFAGGKGGGPQRVFIPLYQWA